MSVGVISSLIHSLLDRETITAGRQATHARTNPNIWIIGFRRRFQGFVLTFCTVSMICEDCFRILKEPTVTNSAGRLCRFPPVSRRKGSMTSQSGIQWVMFAPCHPPPPSHPARLPLSDKPLSCPIITLVQRLYLDAVLLSGPSAILNAVIDPLTVSWEVCWDPVQCAVLLSCLCCGCGGWCASSVPARCLMV